MFGRTVLDTRRQICCSSPRCDHTDIPLRYVLACQVKHWINAALVRLARWRYLS